MEPKRKVEIFIAGCPACEAGVARIRELACASCEIEVLDMHQADVAARAKHLGIASVPAVVIDGKLSDCCARRGLDEAALSAAGLGTPLA